MNPRAAARLKQFADVARYRGLTEAGRKEIYRLLEREEKIDAKVKALIVEWKNNRGLEGVDFADELCEAIQWYPEYEEDE